MFRKILIASVIAATAGLGGVVAKPADANAGVSIRIGKDHHNKRWHRGNRQCWTDYKTVKTRHWNSYRNTYVVKVVRKPITRCR